MGKIIDIEIFKWVTINGTHVEVSGSNAAEGKGFDFDVLKGESNVKTDSIQEYLDSYVVLETMKSKNGKLTAKGWEYFSNTVIPLKKKAEENGMTQEEQNSITYSNNKHCKIKDKNGNEITITGKKVENVNKITPKELQAMSLYQNYGFINVNNALREGKHTTESKEMTDNLDSAISKSKITNNVLYRADGAATTSKLFEDLGITKELNDYKSKNPDGLKRENIFLSSSKAPDGKDWNSYLNSKLVGKVYSEKSFMSTSRKEGETESVLSSGAKRFLSGSSELSPYGITAIVKLSNVKGKNGINIDEHTKAGAAHEAEILLGRNNSYKIDHVTLKPHSDKVYMYLEIEASLQ